LPGQARPYKFKGEGHGGGSAKQTLRSPPLKKEKTVRVDEGKEPKVRGIIKKQRSIGKWEKRGAVKKGGELLKGGKKIHRGKKK